MSHMARVRAEERAEMEVEGLDTVVQVHLWKVICGYPFLFAGAPASRVPGQVSMVKAAHGAQWLVCAPQ
jgi:hypothetical protein